jgi:17beta-estradiol 17-dehydrogenase / very-long-chain 3-oxoacyl-CoA reductase
MTQIILPQMVERKKGVIINVSSLAAVIPAPLLTVYGASKVS